MRYVLVLITMMTLGGCGMSRSERLDLSCSMLLAVAEPMTAAVVRELDDDELVDLGAALDRVNDGVNRLDEIVQEEIDSRQVPRVR